MKREFYLEPFKQPSSQPFKDSYIPYSPYYPQECAKILICQANDDLDAAIKTVRDMVSSLRLDVDARRRKAPSFFSNRRL